jgi:phage terminase small subunit
MTPSNRVFADEWLKCRHITKAYRFAYPNCKTDYAASTNGTKLLKNAEIKAYIDKKLDEISRKAGLTVQRVLEEEARLSLSDMREIFDGETAIKPSDLPEDIARAIKGFKVKERKVLHPDGDTEIITTYEYSFWDKGASLQRVEKYLGMHTEKIDLTTNGQEINTSDEVLRRLAFILRNKDEEGNHSG